MFWHGKRRKPEVVEPAPPPVQQLDLAAALVSDVGCHRELNEDSGRIVQAGQGRGLLVIVADGMGGHQAGEVASQTAVETIGKEYTEGKGSPGECLSEAFLAAHRRIYKMAQSDAGLSGMGTTCTALAIVGAEAWAAHVGDSRLYLLRNGSIYQLSEDHTQCMEMVRRGLMTLAEAHQNEDRNILTYAMGTRTDLNAVVWDEPMSVRPGDYYLLCSDGMHDLVSEPEILQVVRGTAAEAACHKLVTMAKERGGYDNITVAVVSVPAPDDGASQIKETRTYEVIG
jgi:PPM family protein phosphatase